MRNKTNEWYPGPFDFMRPGPKTPKLIIDDYHQIVYLDYTFIVKEIGLQYCRTTRSFLNKSKFSSANAKYCKSCKKLFFKNLNVFKLRKIEFQKLRKKHFKDTSYNKTKLHKRVRKLMTLSEYCVICNESKKLVLSNLDGLYSENPKDYWWLCASCHVDFDNLNLTHFWFGRLSSKFLSKGVVDFIYERLFSLNPLYDKILKNKLLNGNSNIPFYSFFKYSKTKKSREILRFTSSHTFLRITWCGIPIRDIVRKIEYRYYFSQFNVFKNSPRQN